ncbi:anti-phage dCTP deaminase [Bosea beijingensis]
MLKKSKSELGKDSTGIISNPELIFGIVGPIGVDLDSVIEAISRSLREMNYDSHVIHLTEHIRDERIKISISDSSYFDRYKSLIEYGNAFRELAKDPSAIAGIAIAKIREIRESLSGSADVPALGKAYIIRQFKRPEEIELMRRVYGRKFIQVSVYGSAVERRSKLISKIQSFNASPKANSACEKEAIELIDMDHMQKDNLNGQRLSDVFHLGDVFVDGVDAIRSSTTIERFIKAFFGDNRASPNKDEYGLYIATAASFRSVDLSRQVGAAIFSNRGEVISLGCNEVPKPQGGTYWSDDPDPIARDIELGNDPNQGRRDEIIFDLLDRMFDENLLSEELSSVDSQSRVKILSSKSKIKESQLMDIIEFGRIIHAEMSAISDAARLGRPTKDATLYCTTFPCHLCAKHIVASGVERVIFLEPYPKSYAQKLHSDSITFDRNVEGKVLFQPFMGISPRRYRDIFEKRKRKNSNGKALQWYEGQPAPLIEDRSGAYVENEQGAIYASLKELYPSDEGTQTPS